MRPASLPLWIPLVLLIGCRDAANGGAQSPDAGRDAGVVRDAGADMGQNPDASADADAGGDPRAWTPADALYVGRFDAADPSSVRLSWPGSGFVVRFRGSAARATMRGGSHFTVVVDGVVQANLLTVSGRDAVYEFASDRSEGEHTVQVYRRTEAFEGPTVVGDVEVFGEPLTATRPIRQMEIVSDSWSTGAALAGPGENCMFSRGTANHFLSWGAIAARAVDAELSTVALSGIGVVRNEAGSREEQMLARYNRVLADEADSTGTIQPVDAVFVSIGANDFVEGELPTDFVPGYASLLELIRARHPDALIACVWPELDSAEQTESARTAIDAAVAQRVADGDTQVQGIAIELEELADLACDDFHPGVDTHAAMADNAVMFLMSELGW